MKKQRDIEFKRGDVSASFGPVTFPDATELVLVITDVRGEDVSLVGEDAIALIQWIKSLPSPSEPTANLAGPYCPDSRQPCERMCQTVCHVRAANRSDEPR